MTTIKIRDKQWFEKNCKVIGATEYGSYIAPKWKHASTPTWSLDGDMGQLVGQVLEVECDDGVNAGSMNDARYFARNYWIPNWAIEWVKEEPEASIKHLTKGIRCLTKEEALRACDIIAWASKQGYLGRTEAKDLCSKVTYNNKGWL